jgi:glutamate formiminotransferase/formiminotetrahydrofolate cyclodeaminase
MGPVECVPNVSEGRDPETIRAVVSAAAEVPGVVLLGVDPGPGVHRTVVTFAGAVDAVAEGAFRAVRAAVTRIDMTRHTGAHPRIGAADVCPFAPLDGATLGDCIALAESVGARIGRELDVPVYLYGAAARRPERRWLPAVRRGGYEALEARLGRPEGAPDFGPARFVARTGAIAVGARPILIAWNVNLATSDPAPARAIAAALRETGGVVTAGERRIRTPGRFRGLQANGWYDAALGRSQVTCNVLDWRATPLLDLYRACEVEAERNGTRVTGSQLVGLAPEAALAAAGTGASADARLAAAVRALGLDELAPFDPDERVLERAWHRRLRDPLVF